MAARTPAPSSSANADALQRDGARLENLAHFAVDDALLVAALRVSGDHAPPEAHRRRVAQVLGDLPASREAVEDQRHGRASDAQPPLRAGDEEFRHAVVGARLAGPLRPAARHHGKSHRLLGLAR